MIVDGVTEYCEGMPIEIELDDETAALKAYRESGLFCVAIDIRELLCWFAKNTDWEADLCYCR